MKPLILLAVAIAASAGEPSTLGRIDRLVFDDWKRMAIQPANPATDEVFLRRACRPELLIEIEAIAMFRTHLAS